jgi:orotidine-5'-phosphate decarboxylase
MRNERFRDLLEHQWAQGKFFCGGLDTDYKRLPKHLRDVHGHEIDDAIREFNYQIVDATIGTVGMYKPQIAFYEKQGPLGLTALRDTIHYIHRVRPDLPVILDAKRGDIGATNEGYVELAFDYLEADAVTLHPYLGIGALKPFLARKEKGCIILCRTSNPEAGEFQNLIVEEDGFRGPLYKYVAHRVTTRWNSDCNCSLVVGATFPEELALVRQVAGDLPILIPGFGKQGGRVEDAVPKGKDSRGKGIICNVASDMIYASNGRDFAEAAGRVALDYHTKITAALAPASSGT